MDEQLRTELILAIKNSEWQRVEEIIRGLKPEDLVDAHLALAAAHGAEIDLILMLESWPESHPYTAMEYLFPAIKDVDSISADEVIRLLKIVDVDQRYVYSAMAHLQPHFVRIETLGPEVGGRIIHDNSVVGRAGARAWSGAFCSASPMLAARFASDRLKSGAAAPFYLSILLQDIPVEGFDCLEILRPGELEFIKYFCSVSGEDRSDAMRALSFMSLWSAEAKDAVLEAIRGGDADAISVVATWLPSVKASAIDRFSVDVEQLVGEILHAVLEYKLDFPEFDICLSALIHRPDLRYRIVPLLEPLGKIDVKFGELIPNTLMGIGDDPSGFRRILTSSRCHRVEISARIRRCVFQ